MWSGRNGDGGTATGKAIPTRRTNLSTPMPQHHDPFRQHPQPRPKEKEEKEPPSARGTIRGVPAMLPQEVEPTAELQAALMETPFEEPPIVEPTPFEEPRVDEFGTGHGV